ncbi:chemotaxis protein CheB [Rhodanobacter sp. 115]|nr:chemotaxis protein CheB [Rhodanobacter sp. 115]EIL96268.1 chemotaxis response regulator [Rhodanobacter sp. 115]
MLDDLGSALSRLVVLGATTEGTESVCRFLSALPAGLRVTVLHTQHLAGKPADGLVEYLAQHCALPVRLVEPGLRARIGEVLVVPSDQQVRLLRDGSIELQPIGGASTSAPSIDVSFTMAASVFGRDAVAIVFAGSSTDAVGGCQAIHDRGGKVWVEASSGEHFADMVSGVMAEHLSQFSGTPHELAVHLVEEFQMEGRQ